MGTKQLLGLIGSIALFVGVFAPIVSVPIMGNMNYFQNGKGDGTLVLVLAVASFILVLSKTTFDAGLLFTGLGSMAVLAFTFINFRMKMSEVEAQMETELAGNPFRGLADMAMQSVQLQWGWALLIVGAALVIASAAIEEKSTYEQMAGPATEKMSEVVKEAEGARLLANETKTLPLRATHQLPTVSGAATAMRQFCGNCGAKVSTDDTFCNRCGERQNNPSTG